MSLRNRTAPKPMGDASLTERRAPRNPKYADIASTLNTGNKARGTPPRSVRSVAATRNEAHGRISVQRLAELVAQVHTRPSERMAVPAAGAGPRIVAVEAAARAGTADDAPYLLVDVRTADEFTQCHLVDAVHFTERQLNMDQLSAELFRYKRKEDSVVVVYDDEGNPDGSACAVATRLVQRGFPKVAVLHGGLHAAVLRASELVIGIAPEHLAPAPEPRTARAPGGIRRHADTASVFTASSRRSVR